MWFSKKKQFSLVLEFFAESMEDFERLVTCEEKIRGFLQKGEVDGHDIGGGIFNIFIVTNEPVECFKEALPRLTTIGAVLNAAGYRVVDEEDYIRLWPEDDSTPFELH